MSAIVWLQCRNILTACLKRQIVARLKNALGNAAIKSGASKLSSQTFADNGETVDKGEVADRGRPSAILPFQIDQAGRHLQMWRWFPQMTT